MTAPTTQRLTRSPRLMPALGRGVLTGIGKRPSPGAPLPGTRLLLPAARIDAGRVVRYARVCGFRETDPLPLTYPHILGFPLAARLMGDRAFPLPLLGLVHTGIEITQHRALRPHDRPELTVAIPRLLPHRRGTEAEVVTEARIDGELVWTDRSTYLARHRTAEAPEAAEAGHGADASGAAETGGARESAPAPESSQSASPAPESAAPEASAPDARASRGDGADGLPAAAVWQLPAGLGRHHAAVSGDYNPIHLHPLTARPLGFPRAIAHGMWTFARCVAETDASSAERVTVRAEFKAPVLLPSTVVYHRLGAAFELRGGRDGSRLHLTGTVTTPAGA
ncbi:MaoC/PaaZ C-terminal domain-containing protein [Streptomyces albus]|uniref:MaoC/PaaZ C-terminal domain-containing protein n=1 Tax=Streptomyces albus TaxID=1888 RepID=UPI0004C99DE9|nr:MaoC/PaaZ C-terminal domain-containing protein [Streptomyces albus]